MQKAFYISVCFAKITFCFVCREIWANILDLPKGNRNFNMRTGMNESPKKLQHTRVLNFWNHYFVVINSRFYVYNSSLQLHFKLKKGVCMLWKRNAINLQDLLPTHGRKKAWTICTLFSFSTKTICLISFVFIIFFIIIEISFGNEYGLQIVENILLKVLIKVLVIA